VNNPGFDSSVRTHPFGPFPSMNVFPVKERRDVSPREASIQGFERALLVAALSVSSILFASCTAKNLSRRVDRTANRVLYERTKDTLGAREETVVWPEEVEETDAEESGEGERATPEERVEAVSLARALSLGVTSNRDYLAQEENLFLAALSLAETRHAFTPLLSSALGFIFDGDGLPEDRRTSFSAGVDMILPWGGSVSLNGSSSLSDLNNSPGADSSNFNSNLSLQLVQPLLRGAGAEESHEALTAAERNMVYSIRDFELFREDFSIDVARRYYDLVQQAQSIDNERRNMEELTFAEQQAQALFDVGRTRELDVLRARRNRLNADNRLIEALENYEAATDRFRIFLGLPTNVRVEIIKGAPEFVPVTYDVESAVEVALLNRLDLINRREQLEDFERAVRISKNDLLPDLDFNASVNAPAGPNSSFSNQNFDNESLSLGLSLEIPVDRVNESSSYRRAQIRLTQAQRSFEEFQDNLIVTVESAFRELERRKLSLEIQRQLIQDEQKNVRVAQLRFERGEIPNRDVVEAQQSLLDARNSLIREQVNYEIARLGLLRDLGIVFIDEQGMWIE